MGLWDIIKKAAGAVAHAVANPISTVEAVVESPVKLIHAIEHAANTMDEMPNALRELIKTDGDFMIHSLIVFREPVNAAVRLSAHILTGGSLTMNIRHVFEVFVLVVPHEKDALKYVRIEKNEIVQCQELNLDQLNALKRTHEHMTIQDKKLSQLDLKLYFDNYIAHTDPKVLWLYDPATANCQVFVYLGLKSNEIRVTKQMEDFIVQKEVKQQIGAVSGTIMKGITTMANFTRHLLHLGADGEVLEAPDLTLQWALQAENRALWYLLNRHATLCMRFTHDLWDFCHQKPPKPTRQREEEKGQEEEQRPEPPRQQEPAQRDEEDEEENETVGYEEEPSIQEEEIEPSVSGASAGNPFSALPEFFDDETRYGGTETNYGTEIDDESLVGF